MNTRMKQFVVHLNNYIFKKQKTCIFRVAMHTGIETRVEAGPLYPMDKRGICPEPRVSEGSYEILFIYSETNQRPFEICV